jgi:hypothetical protein
LLLRSAAPPYANSLPKKFLHSSVLFLCFRCSLSSRAPPPEWSRFSLPCSAHDGFCTAASVLRASRRQRLFLPTFLALRHIFRATESLGQRAAAVRNRAPCEGPLRLENRAVRVVICSLVRFFASNTAGSSFGSLLPGSPVFVLGFALRHGSQFAVSPRFSEQPA